MRLPGLQFLRGSLLAVAVASSLFGQSYTISTFAGGGLPVNIPGTSASIGQPGASLAVSVDQAGNMFLSYPELVLRLGAATGILTLVAGNGFEGYGGDGGPATSAQLNNPKGVAVDSAGNVYIVDGFNFRIRKVSNGVITTVAGNGTQGFSGDGGPATSAEFSGLSGIAVDSAGNLYISDGNRVREVSNGVITTVAGNGTTGFSGDGGPAINAELWGPIGLAVDSAGNLYIADGGSQRIRKVSQGVITTVAGNAAPLTSRGVVIEFPGGFSGDGGLATSALLAGPNGVAVDSAGNLYICDAGNQRIREVSGGVINTVAGNGTSGFTGDNGPAISAGLSFPQGIAVDSAGNIYIADALRIRKVSNGVITTVAGFGTDLGDNGPATGPNAQLNGPSGVAVDSAGNLYVADPGNNRIRKVSDGVITTVAGSGPPQFGGYSGDGGPATSAQLSFPEGVAVDSAGNLYVADTTNNVVRKVSNGVITTVAGNGTQGVAGMGGCCFSGDGGPATSAELFGPADVAVDSAGNLYIDDSFNHRIRKVSNSVIATVAGNGTNGFNGDGGPAASAELSDPGGIALDSAGNLYIADGVRVREVSGGVITTVAGNGNAAFSGDGGPATSAGVTANSVAVDSAGNLYIADGLSNHRVRKVSNGVITTIAGNGTEGFSGDGGPATSAQLVNPQGIAVDSAGNVYFTDNNRVRLLTPSGSSCPASASPVNFTPPVSGGNLSITVQTTAACPWAVQSLPSWIMYSGNALGSGPGTITLAVSANAGPARNAVISVAGILISVAQASGGVSLNGNGAGIANAASYAAVPVSPGSIATIYGSFPVTGPGSAAGLPLPTSLAGLSLQFSGGMQAPLFFADVGQASFQVPWELAGQSQTSLTAVLNGQMSSSQSVNLAPFSPGIFSTNGEGTGQGAILDTLYYIPLGTTAVGPGSVAASYVLADSSNPVVMSNPMIQIYCTGLGPVTNQPATGSPALNSPLSITMTTPTVTVDSVNAPVMFSGLAPGLVGVYQVNVVVPPIVFNSGARQVPVVLYIGGQMSNTVTMAVQ